MNKPYESYNIDLVGATKVNELTDIELTNLANGEVLLIIVQMKSGRIRRQVGLIL